MNRNFNAFRRITTSASVNEVFQATEDALRRLGGSVMRTGSGFMVAGGTANVSMAFSADFEAVVTIQQREQGTYEIYSALTLKPNQTFWICAVVGLFCLWPLWVVNLFYFICDPLPVYQRTLDQIVLPA